MNGIDLPASQGFDIFAAKSWEALDRFTVQQSIEKLKHIQKEPSSAIGTAGDPTASLESLPLELLDIIVCLLPRSEQGKLCRVSFRILLGVTRTLYRCTDVSMNSRQAALFIRARISSKPSRITECLLPDHPFLTLRPVQASSLSLLADFKNLPPVSVPSIIIENPISTSFTTLAPILRMLDPAKLQMGYQRSTLNTPAVSPSVVHISSSSLSFALRWSRLSRVFSDGRETFTLIAGYNGTFALSSCFQRCGSKGGKIEFSLVSLFPDGRNEMEVVEESALLARLDEKSDGTKRDGYLGICWQSQ